LIRSLGIILHQTLGFCDEGRGGGFKNWPKLRYVLYGRPLFTLMKQLEFHMAHSWNGSYLIWAYRYHKWLYAICFELDSDIKLAFCFWRGETWLVVNTCPSNDLYCALFFLCSIGPSYWLITIYRAIYSCNDDYHYQKYKKELYLSL
jgi:hypothetical protein